jgi:hypothetical protein
MMIPISGGEDDIESFADGHDKVFLILSHYIFNYDGGEVAVKNMLERNFNATESAAFPGIEVYIYEPRPITRIKAVPTYL